MYVEIVACGGIAGISQTSVLDDGVQAATGVKDVLHDQEPGNTTRASTVQH